MSQKVARHDLPETETRISFSGLGQWTASIVDKHEASTSTLRPNILKLDCGGERAAASVVVKVVDSGAYRGAMEVGIMKAAALSRAFKAVTYVMLILRYPPAGRLPTDKVKTSGRTCASKFACFPSTFARLYSHMASPRSFTKPCTMLPSSYSAWKPHTAAPLSIGKW